MIKPSWLGDSNKSIAILRVSTSKQKQSHITQEKEVKDYCAARDLHIEKIFYISESAKDSDNRKQYAEALNYALANGIRHVVFYMQDREARNLTDNEHNEKLVKADIIAIHYIKDQRVIWKDSPDADFFLRDIQAVTAKDYSRRLSKRVQDALRVKAESGWYPSNHIPLGYVTQKLRDENGKELEKGAIIGPDPNEMKVKQAYREYELRGYYFLPYREIRKQIIKEGYIQPSKARKYSVHGIEKRLKNLFYRGRFKWQGVEYEGKHEIIIPKQLSEAVDRTFGKSGIKPREFKDGHGILANGWLKCGHPECGCTIIYDPKSRTNKNTGVTKTHHYYHCTNGKMVHESMKGMNVAEEILWEQLATPVDDITIEKEFAQQVSDALNEANEKSKAAVRRDIAAYQKALDGLEVREDEVYEDYKSRVLNDAGYKRQFKKIREERKYFTNLMEQAQVSITDAFMETAESILELATSAKTLWLQRSPQERRDFLDQLLSNKVLDGATIRYQTKKPFQTLSEMALNSENKSWLPKGDSNTRQAD